MQPYPPYGAPPPAMPPAYGTPQPGYMPPPGYYPPPPPTFHTREGVSYFSKALLLQVLIGLIGFVIALAAIAMIVSLGTGSWGAALGTIVAIAGAAFLILVFAIIYIILALVGIVKFYQGKDEFGPVHAKNFGMAIVFFILGIIIPYVGNAFSPSYGYGSSVNTVYDSIRTSLMISGVMGVIAPIFMGLGLTTLVKQFTTDEASKFKTGLILLIVGPIIGLVVTLVIFPAKPGTGVSVSDLTSFYSVASLSLSMGGIVSLIGYFFFYQGYKSILAKMDSGVIRPGAMPVPMAPPGYAPPPAPYQPPPAPYQPPPQPYQPPPPAQYPQQPPPQYPPPQY